MLRRLATCQCQLAAALPRSSSVAGSQSMHSSSRRSAKVSGTGHLLQQHLFSSSPRWNDESMAAVRDKYEQKYKDRLEKKAQE